MAQFTLWLAAGSNNVLPSGDPFAHHLFMRCLFHAKHDPTIKFDVKTINVNKKSQEFKETGLTRVPGIRSIENEMDGDLLFEMEDDMMNYLESLSPSRLDDDDAEKTTIDIFRQFARFVKDVAHNAAPLNTELLRLDNYISQQGTKFLVTDEVNHIDCLVLTRLHSIRIAGKALKNYEIPKDLSHVLNYMRAGYDQEMFRLSCPSDQEIVIHWSELKDTPNLTAQERAKMVREEPNYSFNI